MFVFPSHLCTVVDVVVLVVSHPLHVLSHSPGTIEHKPCVKIVWHLNNDNLLRRFTQRSGLEVILVEVVLFGVEVVVASQPLHVLAHCAEKELHRSALDKILHLANEKVFVLLAHLSTSLQNPSLSASLSQSVGHESLSPHIASLSTSFSGSRSQRSKHSNAHAHGHILHLSCAEQSPWFTPPILYGRHVFSLKIHPVLLQCMS